jgi:hypothetical protein
LDGFALLEKRGHVLRIKIQGLDDRKGAKPLFVM